MKSQLKKTLLAVFVALSLIGVSGVADAYVTCRVVSGHWAHGRWIAAQRVCWGGPGPGRPAAHCGWVNGHWYYGRWVPGHRACW